jgi:hypothetical protein
MAKDRKWSERSYTPPTNIPRHSQDPILSIPEEHEHEYRRVKPDSKCLEPSNDYGCLATLWNPTVNVVAWAVGGSHTTSYQPPQHSVTTFHISDPSVDGRQSISVVIRHLSETELPKLGRDDCIILRDFIVRYTGGKPYLINGSKSSWCRRR